MSCFCILCQAKVKAVKVSAQAMKVAEKESKHKSAGNGSAAKKMSPLYASCVVWPRFKHSSISSLKLRN
jgi:hypothetical protein